MRFTDIKLCEFLVCCHSLFVLNIFEHLMCVKKCQICEFNDKQNASLAV